MVERIPRIAAPIVAPQMQNISPKSGRKAKRDAIRDNRAKARALVDDPPLTAPEAAAERGVALSTWWKHVKSGRFPAPFYPLPRCPRWRRSEVRE